MVTFPMTSRDHETPGSCPRYFNPNILKIVRVKAWFQRMTTIGNGIANRMVTWLEFKMRACRRFTLSGCVFSSRNSNSNCYSICVSTQSNNTTLWRLCRRVVALCKSSPSLAVWRIVQLSVTSSSVPTIGVGDGRRGAAVCLDRVPPPLPPKNRENTFRVNYYVKLGHFSGKNRVKFGLLLIFTPRALRF